MDPCLYKDKGLYLRDGIMGNFFLTLLVALIFGYIFLKLKVPGAMMIGSIVGVSLLNITTGMAYMPPYSRTFAQIIAGAFIAIGLERSDLKRLKDIIKPTLVLLVGMFILNITLGSLIYLTSPLDLTTSLMSAVPGGMSDIPIISEEMGADSSKVALLQFIRMTFGIGIFPSIIARVSRLEIFKDETEYEVYKRASTNEDTVANLMITTIIASICGFMGKWTGIPSATLVFAMIGTIIYKLITNKGSMPRWMRRFAQVLSGSYIGSTMVMDKVMELKYLILPAILIVLGYLIACFIIGLIIHKKYKMPMDEAMLAATPAGASDMALISADIGIESADVIAMQIIRMVSVVSFAPQLVRFIVSSFE